MKSLPFIKVVTLAALLILIAMVPGIASEAGPRWVLADENPSTRFYIDSDGITSPRKGISRVTVRVVYTEEGKEEALDVLGHDPGFAKLFDTRYSYDIDCQKKKIHLLHVTHLDEAGNQIKSVNLSAATEWEDIPPGTRLDLLAEEICPQ